MPLCAASSLPLEGFNAAKIWSYYEPAKYFGGKIQFKCKKGTEKAPGLAVWGL